MASKLNKLSELQSVLSDEQKTNEGVLAFATQFNVSQLLKSFSAAKAKGFLISTLITALCLYRLSGKSIWAMQRVGNKNIFEGDENCFYRLLNNEKMNWRGILMSFARRFKALTEQKGDLHHQTKCFVIDDTDIEKSGKTFESLSRVFNHVIGKHVLGFKTLVLGYWDGKSLIAADFSLHREKGKHNTYGLNPKERNGLFKKKRQANSPSMKRVKEVDKSKMDVAVEMIQRAVKNGFVATYVLMDSWFTSDGMIKAITSIKKIKLHVLGMCKMDNRKFTLENKALNSHQIIVRKEHRQTKYSRKHNSHYIAVTANYKGIPVKLFYIRYRNSKNWTLMLTTDLRLNFVKAFELYQIRWTIEVLFKECKQYLRLGACQNTDFDGQIADTTLAFVTHTILTLQRRFYAYETLGELFRQHQQNLLELTLWERILQVFLKMLRQLLGILAIDVDQTIELIFNSEKANSEILLLLSVLQDESENPQYKHDSAA
jgi:hypothetical protein